jgi:hypothetical protein
MQSNRVGSISADVDFAKLVIGTGKPSMVCTQSPGTRETASH